MFVIGLNKVTNDQEIGFKIQKVKKAGKITQKPRRKFAEVSPPYAFRVMTVILGTVASA